MGISKAMMEKIAVAKSRVAANRDCVITATRYGNVMASRGSVIPLFIRQIQAGEPLTITDPNMTRFMMTIADAVDLVIYAFENANPGDLFVQKAPAATVQVLAEALQGILGTDNEIKHIGIRHGEKPYETLLTREEMLFADDMGGYYRVPADNRDLNYDLYFTDGVPTKQIEEDYNSHNTDRLDVAGMTKLLHKLDIIGRALKGEPLED
jgi:UDP-N-acetylglucosamine 4,6-dehydratase